jgi:hypothetical protein
MRANFSGDNRYRLSAATEHAMYPLAQLPLMGPAWIFEEIGLPALVGVGAGLLGILTFHFLIRPGKPGGVVRIPRKAEAAYDPFVEGSASEQRMAHRRTGNPVEVWVRLPPDELSQQHGYVLDRSVGGLCLLLENSFPNDTVLHVRPANAPPITPWVAVTVRSSRQTREGWQLGCQFIRTPPWAILLMFG